MQSSRVDGKAKQRNILYLGSDPILRDKDKRKIVLEFLKSGIFKRPSLFPLDAPGEVTDLAMALYEKYFLKYGSQTEGLPSTPAPEHLGNYHRVDVDSIESRQVRSFWAGILCCQIMDKLQFRKIFNSPGFSKDQIYRAMIAIAARAIFASSDHSSPRLLKTNVSTQPTPYCLGKVKDRPLPKSKDEKTGLDWACSGMAGELHVKGGVLSAGRYSVSSFFEVVQGSRTGGCRK